MAEEEAKTVKYELKIHTLQDTVKELEENKTKLQETIRELEAKIEQQKADQADIYYYLNKKCDDSYEIISSLEEQLANEQADREAAEKGYEARIDEIRTVGNNLETKLSAKIIELENKVESLALHGLNKEEMERNMTGLMNTLEEERRQFSVNAETMENKFLLEREKLRKQYESKYENLKKELESSVDMKVSKKTQRTQIMNVLIRKELATQSKHADRLLEINDSIVERERNVKVELDLSNSLLEEMTKKLHKQERINKKLSEEIEILIATLQQKEEDAHQTLQHKIDEIEKLTKRQNQFKRLFDKQESQWDELWEFLSDTFHRIQLSASKADNNKDNKDNSTIGSNNSNYNSHASLPQRGRGLRSSISSNFIAPILSTEQKEEMLIELLRHLTMKYPNIVQQYLPLGNQLTVGNRRGTTRLSATHAAPSPQLPGPALLYGPRYVTSPKHSAGNNSSSSKPAILVQAMQDLLPNNSWESLNISESSSISQQPQQPSYLSQSYDSSTTLLHDHTAPSWLNKSSHPPSSSSYHPDNASINSSSIATTFSPLSSQHDPTNAIWMMPATHTNANGNDLHQGSVTDNLSVISNHTQGTQMTVNLLNKSSGTSGGGVATTVVQRIPYQPNNNSNKQKQQKQIEEDGMNEEEIAEEAAVGYHYSHHQYDNNKTPRRNGTNSGGSNRQQKRNTKSKENEPLSESEEEGIEEQSTIMIDANNNNNHNNDKDDDQQSTQSSLYPISSTLSTPLYKPLPPGSNKQMIIAPNNYQNIQNTTITSNGSVYSTTSAASSSASSSKATSMTSSVKANLPKQLKLRLKNHDATNKFYTIPSSPRDPNQPQQLALQQQQQQQQPGNNSKKSRMHPALLVNPTRIKYYIDHHQAHSNSQSSGGQRLAENQQHLIVQEHPDFLEIIGGRKVSSPSSSPGPHSVSAGNNKGQNIFLPKI